MKEIKIYDKDFEIFINANEIDKIIFQIADDINNSGIKNPLFIAILNGSFLFAADLIRKITIPNSEISFLKLSSYSGIKSTGNVDELIGLSNSINGRDIIVLEDIVDTGITLEKIILLLDKEKVNSIKIATLLFKPNAYQKEFPIDYVGKSIENDFVVGYGLDYDEKGRNLKNIYKLKN